MLRSLPIIRGNKFLILTQDIVRKNKIIFTMNIVYDVVYKQKKW